MNQQQLVRTILTQAEQASGTLAGEFEPVTAAPGVHRLGIVFVNVYAVDVEPAGGTGARRAGSGPFVLIDAGLPLSAPRTRAAVEARYGPAARPEAVVLTHAHFDHAGGLEELATGYDCPVYAHPLEMPYLNGGSDYAPPDPTPGGAICFLSRFFPRSGRDLRDVADLRPLPDDGSIPPMPGWRWVHTPGHTSGHVSLFRESDRTLIAGDALATVDLDSWPSQVTWERELARPATPFTPDWGAARSSVDALVDLEPNCIAAGHGKPMSGPGLSDRLRAFAGEWEPPPHGRYVGCPATYRPDGSLADVPPPPPDPMKGKLTAAAAVAALGVGLFAARGLRKR